MISGSVITTAVPDGDNEVATIQVTVFIKDLSSLSSPKTIASRVSGQLTPALSVFLSRMTNIRRPINPTSI